MATGRTTIDFGAGATDATVVVTGQTGILADSFVEAWVEATATADHSIDEHVTDGPRVMAGSVVAGVGFTIHGVPQNFGRLYGEYNVAWVWV